MTRFPPSFRRTEKRVHDSDDGRFERSGKPRRRARNLSAGIGNSPVGLSNASQKGSSNDARPAPSRQKRIGRHAKMLRQCADMIECEFAFAAQDHRTQVAAGVQTTSSQRPKPVPTRFHNDKRRRQFILRITAENLFQFLVRRRQSFGKDSQEKHAFAQTLDEDQPAKIFIACDEQPLLLSRSHQQARIRGTRKIQVPSRDDIVIKTAKQVASYCVNVLVEQKPHEGAPT